ncbi:MAG: hypothetical protein IKD66_00375 [Solobacterium sp.]|nr:hypothetical protein [Solobacterium sp.]
MKKNLPNKQVFFRLSHIFFVSQNRGSFGADSGDVFKSLCGLWRSLHRFRLGSPLLTTGGESENMENKKVSTVMVPAQKLRVKMREYFRGNPDTSPAVFPELSAAGGMAAFSFSAFFCPAEKCRQGTLHSAFLSAERSEG